MKKIQPFPYRNVWHKIVIAVVCLFLGLFLSLWLYGQNHKRPESFRLTDHNGQIYNSAEDEMYKLIFFGFTNCPDVCPTGLTHITKTLDFMGEGADQIHPLFITVDPDRDTPQTIKAYLKNFHPRLMGLTGAPGTLEAVQKQYAVYAQKVKPPEYDEYVMNHSAHVYFTNKDDIVVEIFEYNLLPEDMAERMRAFIQPP